MYYMYYWHHQQHIDSRAQGQDRNIPEREESQGLLISVMQEVLMLE